MNNRYNSNAFINNDNHQLEFVIPNRLAECFKATGTMVIKSLYESLKILLVINNIRRFATHDTSIQTLKL